MNKIEKYVVIIVGILILVALLPLGYVRYKTHYEVEQISTSMSPDGDHELVIYSVGEPDFPFGSAHGRLKLKGKEKAVAYMPFEVANDGAGFDVSDLYVDSVSENQPNNEEIIAGYHAIYEKYSDATAGKFEVYYGASESSSRCRLSERDNLVEYIVYDGKSENGKCELYVRYRAEKGGDGTYDYGSAEIEDIYAYVFSSGEVISSGKTSWEDTGTDEFERATE